MPTPLDIFQAAIDAIDAYREAHRVEDERFAAWFKGERHVNAVRAAERKTERVSYAMIDAVSEAAKIDDRIGAAWGFNAEDTYDTIVSCRDEARS